MASWTLRGVFWLLTTMALALSIFRAHWAPGSTNHHLLLGTFLVLTTSSLVAAIPGSARLQPGFLGAALFGVAYLVFALQGGLGLETIYDAQALAKYSLQGISLLPLAFLVSLGFADLSRRFKPKTPSPPADRP